MSSYQNSPRSLLLADRKSTCAVTAPLRRRKVLPGRQRHCHGAMVPGRRGAAKRARSQCRTFRGCRSRPGPVDPLSRATSARPGRADAGKSDGGETGQCGWLKDGLGLSWQVIPSVPGELLQDPDAKRAHGVMQAMVQMTKIDIAQLKQAYELDWPDTHSMPRRTRGRGERVA
jgi:hypothetical protein